MKKLQWGLCLLMLIASGYVKAAVNVDQLIQQVREGAKQDRLDNQQRESEFLAEKDLQQQKLAEAKAALKAAEKRAEELRASFDQNEQAIMELQKQLEEESDELNDVFAATRQNVAELQSLVSRSMVTSQFPQRGQFLNDILSSHSHGIAITELRKIWLLLLDEMNQSGKVVRFETPVITAQGEEQLKEVTRIGVFTVTSEGRYLRYLPETNKLVELARQPSGRDQLLARKFEDTSESGFYPMAVDPTKGSILALLVQSPDVWERIRQGGTIGYLILVLGAIGLLIVVYRYVVLTWTAQQIRKQDVHGGETGDNPLGRLIKVAGDVAGSGQEVLGMHLDETINNEASRLYLGLTTLTVFAAVTPLLGLLGTVTGMIETFQSISLYGTGDPKLMSSGISQALITTQLGLAVAIPLLLFHSMLQGKAAKMVEVLESESVHLYEVNGEGGARDRGMAQ